MSDYHNKPELKKKYAEHGCRLLGRTDIDFQNDMQLESVLAQYGFLTERRQYALNIRDERAAHFFQVRIPDALETVKEVLRDHGLQ